MYIPSEGMYYDMLVTKVGSLKEVSVNLIEYAYEHKVILVSPTSFLCLSPDDSTWVKGN